MLFVDFLIWRVQTHTHPHRQTDRQTDRPTDRLTHRVTPCHHWERSSFAEHSKSKFRMWTTYKHVHVMLYALWTFTVLNFSSLIIGKGATDQVRSRSDYVARWRGVAVLAAGALPETDWGLRRCQWLQASVYKCRKYDLFLISLFST